MRRLPVYFLIDVSESMVGRPMDAVSDGMRMVLSQLKQDPYALETVWVSVIVFAGKAKTVVPLTELMSFYPPKLPIGGGTSYERGIEHLIHSMDSEVLGSSAETKGDWKPIVVFISDGAPTDLDTSWMSRWQNGWKNKSQSIALAIGEGVDMRLLERFATTVMKIDEVESNSSQMKSFFTWISASVSANSKSLGLTGEAEGQAVPAELSVESGIESINSNVDDQHAIFLGQCQKHRKGYLIKYTKGTEVSPMLEMDVEVYRMSGAYAIDDTYVDLSDDGDGLGQPVISTENLRGVPNCPVCENSFALCVCSCGGIFCVDGPGTQTCPHCENTSEFGASGGHLDLNRKFG